MRGTLAALGAVAVAAALALSGGSAADPRTPSGLPGMPTPFLGTAVIGSGGGTAAIDSYGSVVDLRASGPAGEPLVAVEAGRQLAGTVAPGSARVARMDGAAGDVPLWRADSVSQRYLPGSNVLVTVARLGGSRARVVRSIGDPVRAARGDRRWLARARPLGAGAPAWARRLQRRSLLVLRALTDRRSGAVAAGARDGWAYVWPRDAAAVALALASAGYRPEARRVVGFLLGLDLDAAARFDGFGAPAAGRRPQGDAAGWVAVAAAAAGMPTAAAVRSVSVRGEWRGRPDYQEKSAGDYLANALASPADGPNVQDMLDSSARRRGFGTPRGLVRVVGDPSSGLDSAAAWAVRPFPRPALFGAARRTLLALADGVGRYGIVPSEDWPGRDPWTAPTAWTAWSLAALARWDRRRRHPAARRDRRAALRLIAALRRAATQLGMLPERVDAQTGLPRSTTPLAWSHAFAILALRELWRRRS